MSFLAPIAQQGLSNLAPPSATAPQQVSQVPPLLAQTYQQYPLLQKYPLQYKENHGGGPGYLESWPPGETGTPDNPRPNEFGPNNFGVEVRDPRTTPGFVAADIVSHHLINVDPQIKQYYQTFQKTLTSKQEDILKDQYQWAKKNESETRSYEDWKQDSGLPGFFRGYAFKQWPDEFNNNAYTPQQRQMFDQMIQYLQGKQ